MGGKKETKPPAKSNLTFIRPPEDLSRHIKGFYAKVARRLGITSSCVRQVAHGECSSEEVENALTEELRNIVEKVSTQRSHARKPTGKKTMKNPKSRKRLKTQRKGVNVPL